ncbi:MAG: aromatic amino acid lyase, partial [Myxococcales bacterium]|nr:aromatic amino acid lyase [Myxococcales bacterium]
LIGEGEVWEGAHRRPAAEALTRAGLEPFRLGPKEGLSLINGTQVMTAIGALALVEAAELITAADAIAALTLDASLGTIAACDPRIHAGKPHPGQQASAAILRGLVDGSPLNQSHADCGQVQDAYSLRCIPQVHGAARGALAYAAAAARVEINSFTDNPLVLGRDDGRFDVVSGGNFHGATVALPFDHMTAALATLATMSERRLDRLMNPHSSRGLPAFLADRPGVESGFMLAHVTAAALASECKSRSFPACVDTIPTSAGKEDHVSMGPLAARKLRANADDLARILALEAIGAARALDLRSAPTSDRLLQVYGVVRAHVGPYQGDRSLSSEVEALAGAILRGEVRAAVALPHPFDG